MPRTARRPLLTPLRISVALHATVLGTLLYVASGSTSPQVREPATFRMVGDEAPAPDEAPETQAAAEPEPIDTLELPDFDVLLPALTVEEDVLPVETAEPAPRPPPSAIQVPRGATRRPEPPPPAVTRPAPVTAPKRAPRQPRRARATPRVVRRPGTLRGFYPRDAQARGIEGTAYVLVQVDRGGQVVTARVHRSSGNGSLDRAALRVAQLYEFAPGMPGRALLPVPFRLVD
ncbi:MAG: TonB family protein [Planctomycetota bacterium]|nr:TonB family protein [Planctomycetota bacterium]